MINKVYKFIFKKNPSPGQRNLIIIAIVIIILIVSGRQIGAIKNYFDFSKPLTKGDVNIKGEKVEELMGGLIDPKNNENDLEIVKENEVIESENVLDIKESDLQTEIISPLDNAKDRIRLKRFGDYITPESSPVSPERFRGYHTGVDFEVYPEELNGLVEVKAACSGRIREKRWVSGYGGVLITECEIDREVITALYGHLNINSIAVKVGDFINAGDIIGMLGRENSIETDRERKHLHFALHKGKEINLRGYVSSETGLNSWLDPCIYICKN